MKRVVVVGGGLAGLAAAHRLTTLDSSINVSLFEATDRTGGNIRTSAFAEYLEQERFSKVSNCSMQAQTMYLTIKNGPKQPDMIIQ